MSGKRVLLIDDSQLIRQMVRMSLEKLGEHRVSTASSGREGLEVAAAEQPEVILLDVMMPDMDGPATFRELQGREATRHIPVVFLSAEEDSAELRELLAQGLARFIAKPFDFKRLPGQLAELMGWS